MIGRLLSAPFRAVSALAEALGLHEAHRPDPLGLDRGCPIHPPSHPNSKCVWCRSS